jgi:hypothetical protein
MDRRTLLKFLATLPFGAFLVPKETQAEPAKLGRLRVNWSAELAKPEPKKDIVVRFDQSLEEMGEQLVQNVRRVSARWEESDGFKRLTADEREVHEGVARRLPYALRNEQYALPEPPGNFTSFDFRPSGQAACPGAWERDLLQKVRFAVMTAPTGWAQHPVTGELVKITAESRKIRAKLNLDALNNLHTYHGLDPVFEAVSCITQDTALEIGMECRRDFAAGMMPAFYAIYLPPFLGPALMDPGDFSISRRYRIRYAKVL